MNKITALLPVTLCLALSGCMSTETTTTKVGKNRGVVTQSVNAAGDTIEVVKSLSCPKPVAKVSIAPLKCKAAKCSNVPQATGNLAVILSLSDQGIQDFSTLGDSMTTMLASSLQATGCFTVLDRETMAEIEQEMRLAGVEFKPDASDYLFTGAITSFEYEKRKSSIGSFLGAAGGLLSNTETTVMLGLDMRLVNTQSSAVDYSETYRSDASKDNYRFGGLGFGGSGGVAAGASFGGDVEVEEAVRTVIDQAVFDLIEHAAKGQYVVSEVEVEAE